MRSSLLLTSSLLAVSAWAAPGKLCKKGACNADNCLRAVRATSASPFAASATADCSSFMKKTVTPCPATSSTVTTVTVTAAPVFVTATNLVTNTLLNTVVATETTVVTTIEDTVTIIQPSTVDVINVIVTAVTVTAAPADKRGLDAKPLPTIPAGLQRREAAAFTTPIGAPATTCAPTTSSPSKVPTYASACSGTSRYSSACSCAGITGATTTVPQSTVTSVSTSTVTVTPTLVNQVTLTDEIPVTVTQTQFVPATFETTDATLVIPTYVTVTSDIVVPTTVVVSPPVCSTYNFVATNGPYNGQFLTADTPDTNAISYGFVDFTSNPSQAQAFVVRPDGRVYGGGNTYGWITNTDSLYYILQMTDRSQSTYGSAVTSVFCTIGGSSSFAGSVGVLSCSASGAPTSLVSCDSTENDLLQTTQTDSGCSAVNLAVVPAC